MGTLVKRARQGDHTAFDALARLVFDDLYAVARRILRDPYAAEDAVQDALIAAWRDIRGLRDPDRFDAWIHRLLVRACYRSSARRRQRVEVHDLSIDAPTPAVDAALADRDEMERAFARLPVDQRVALVLRYYGDMKDAEIAQILAVPVGTVYSRIHNGLAALRAIVEADARLTPRVSSRRSA